MCAIKKLLFATAMTSSACVFAVDHWVDAVNGNDDWDGLSSNYVSGAVGPKRTLQAAMDSLNGGWSHTVYALPGRYDAGGYAAEHARVCVKNRTRLISTGGKDVTFIVGSHTNGAPDSCDVGADVTRCVFMMFDGAVLQGFTLVGGRARKDKSNEYNGGGVYFQAYENGAPSYVVDCTITDCDASRGGGAYGIWSSPSACRFVNCLFTDNKSTSPGANIVKCHAWNCVFATPQCTLSSVSRCTLRNCTVYQAIDNTEAWNTLLPDARDDGSCKFHRCITYAGNKHDSTTWDDGTTTASAAEMALSGRYVPIPGSDKIIDRGNTDAYNGSVDADFDESQPFVAEFKPLLGKDISGVSRVVGGVIDIGAGEFSIGGVDGLKVSVADLGDGTSRLTVAQDPESAHYVQGFVFDGEKVSFDENALGWTWSKVVTGDVSAKPFAVSYLAATDVFVDGTNGSDGDTGVGRFHAIRTFSKAMSKVQSGGTIWVMPGVYRYTENRTVDGNSVSNVVLFTKPNVTLRSVRGAKWTVIEGNPVQDTSGVRCINGQQSGSVVRGFTLLNGGTVKTDGVGNGGGVRSDTSSCTVVDCVIRGCRAGGRGGAAYGAELVRCYLEDCVAGLGQGSAMEGGNCHGCIVKGLVHYGWSGYKDVNCLYFGGGYPSGNVGNSEVHNTLIVGDSGGKCNYHHCVVTGAKQETDGDDDSVFGVAASEYGFDGTTFRPLAGSKLIDAGENASYETYFIGAYKDEYLDFAGGARILGEAIDIGAGEHSAEAARLHACSQALAEDGRVTVTAADAGVAATEAGTVSVPAGAALSLDWIEPFGGTVAATFRYTVELAAGATLKVYENGEVVGTVAVSGEQTFRSPLNHHYTFVAEGGAVVLSGFSNTGVLTVVDGLGRLGVDGAAVGRNEILPGASRTVTFSRTSRVRPLLAGIRVNGEFRSFSGESADVSYSLTFTDAGSATVEAVYDSAYVWYVDAGNGNDENDGSVPYAALRTLPAALRKTVANRNDVVHVAPGVYKDDPMGAYGGNQTNNRIIVPEGVGLVADAGPDETVIEGFTSEEADWAGSIRCVLLQKDAWIRGFTLRNGAAVQTGDYGECGGGVESVERNGSTAIDCVIRDCMAIRGGGVHYADTVRCRFVGNSTDSGSAYYGHHVGSIFDEGQNLYTDGTVVNCTVGGSLWSMSSTKRTQAYNSLVASDRSLVDYHNCFLSDRSLFEPPESMKETKSTLDADSRLGETAAFVFDESGRPASGSTAIDAGRNAYYAEICPERLRQFLDDRDFAGGNRVWGGTIDIGAGEYDWRPAFGKCLGSRVRVMQAGPNVAVDANELAIPAGERIAGVWTMRYETKHFFTVTADETATVVVKLDGATLTPDADGRFTVDGTVGDHAFEIAVTGEGAARAAGFRADRGYILFVR